MIVEGCQDAGVLSPMSDEDMASYRAFFEAADREQRGYITGSEARPMLMQTGLSTSDLKAIWSLADPEGYGALDSARFAVVQHLVRFRLSGHELPSYLPPLLVGSWTEKGGQAKAECKDWIQMAAEANMDQGLAMMLGIPEPQLRQDYWQHFHRFPSLDHDHQGYITGTEAKSHLSATGLPPEELRVIWDIADLNADGALNAHEYAIAMVLVEARRRGAFLDELPIALISGWNTVPAPGSAGPAPGANISNAECTRQQQPVSGGSITCPLPSPREMMQQDTDVISRGNTTSNDQGTVFTSEWTRFENDDEVFGETQLHVASPDSHAEGNEAHMELARLLAPSPTTQSDASFLPAHSWESAPLDPPSHAGKRAPDSSLSIEAFLDEILAPTEQSAAPAKSISAPSCWASPPTYVSADTFRASFAGQAAAISMTKPSNEQHMASPRERFYTALSQHDGDSSPKDQRPSILPLVLLSPPFYPPPPFPAMHEEVPVRMVVGFSVSASNFSEDTQATFCRAIADVAGVASAKVRIDNIEAVTSQSIKFRMEVTVDRCDARRVASKLTADSIIDALVPRISWTVRMPSAKPKTIAIKTAPAQSKSATPLSNMQSPPPIFPPPSRPVQSGTSSDPKPQTTMSQVDSPPTRNIPPPPNRYNRPMAPSASEPPLAAASCHLSPDPFANFLETLSTEKDESTRGAQEGSLTQSACELVGTPHPRSRLVSQTSSAASEENFRMLSHKVDPSLSELRSPACVPRLWFPGETPRIEDMAEHAVSDALPLEKLSIPGAAGALGAPTSGQGCLDVSMAQDVHQFSRPIASSRIEDLWELCVKMDGTCGDTKTDQVQILQAQVSCIQNILAHEDAERKRREQETQVFQRAEDTNVSRPRGISEQEDGSAARRRRDERAKAEEDIRKLQEEYDRVSRELEVQRLKDERDALMVRRDLLIRQQEEQVRLQTTVQDKRWHTEHIQIVREENMRKSAHAREPSKNKAKGVVAPKRVKEQRRSKASVFASSQRKDAAEVRGHQIIQAPAQRRACSQVMASAPGLRQPHQRVETGTRRRDEKEILQRRQAEVELLRAESERMSHTNAPEPQHCQESLFKTATAALDSSQTRYLLSAGGPWHQRRICKDSSARHSSPKSEGREQLHSQSLQRAVTSKNLRFVVSAVPLEKRLRTQVSRELEAALGCDLGSVDVRCVRCGALELELRVNDHSLGDISDMQPILSEILERCAFECTGLDFEIDLADAPETLCASIQEGAGVTESQPQRADRSESSCSLRNSEYSASADALTFRGEEYINRRVVNMVKQKAKDEMAQLEQELYSVIHAMEQGANETEHLQQVPPQGWNQPSSLTSPDADTPGAASSLPHVHKSHFANLHVGSRYSFPMELLSLQALDAAQRNDRLAGEYSRVAHQLGAEKDSADQKHKTIPHIEEVMCKALLSGTSSDLDFSAQSIMAMYAGLREFLRGLALFLPRDGECCAQRLVQLGRVAVFKAALMDNASRARLSCAEGAAGAEGRRGKSARVTKVSSAEKAALEMLFEDEDDVVNEAEACALMAHSVWQETLLAALDDATARYLELARMQ